MTIPPKRLAHSIISPSLWIASLPKGKCSPCHSSVPSGRYATGLAASRWRNSHGNKSEYLTFSIENFSVKVVKYDSRGVLA